MNRAPHLTAEILLFEILRKGLIVLGDGLVFFGTGFGRGLFTRHLAEGMLNFPFLIPVGSGVGKLSICHKFILRFFWK